MILIGLAGPAGAGKTAVADYLREWHGFDQLFFIGNLRIAMHSCARRKVPGIVFDDARSETEADAIRSAGGQIWHIQRPGFLRRDDDLSPSITPQSVDRGILNDGSLEALRERVDQLIRDLTA